MSCTNFQSTFNDQLTRIKRVTCTRTHRELANFLGVKPAAIAEARRRRKIPADWLLVLMRAKNVFPEWILTGRGPCYLPLPYSNYETGSEFAERQKNEDALQRLSTRELADELVRRAALAEAEAFSRK